MAEQSGFFDARMVDGVYDRTYVSEFFAGYFASFIGNGIYAKGGQLVVSQLDEPSMNIQVATGQGWINGYWYRNDDVVTLEIGESSSAYRRKDIVVLQLNLQNREIKLLVKQGTAAATPLEPELTRTDDIYELKLAVVEIPQAAIRIQDSDIQDTRIDSDVCGYVHAVVDQLDSTTFALELRNYIDNLETDSNAEVAALIDELNAMIDAGDVSQIYRRLAQIDENLEQVNVDMEQVKTDVSEMMEEMLNTVLPKPEITGLLKAGAVYYDSETGKTALVKSDVPRDFLYTIRVDNGADATPSSFTYSDDCAGFTPMSYGNYNSWADSPLFDYFKPCVIRPSDAIGEPYYYLQRDDMTKKEDGSTAVLTGADGDVMIEVKKLYGKIVSETNAFTLSISDKPFDNGFCFTTVAGEERDYMYRGAYKAGVLSGATTVMRSVSGVSPLVNQTRAVMRGYATNRGTGYHQNSITLLRLWQAMYLMLYGSRNSQAALGMGYVGASAAQATGQTNANTFCYGSSSNTAHVKMLGCEDFYGNVFEWVDGLVNYKSSNTADFVFAETDDPLKYSDTYDSSWKYTTMASASSGYLKSVQQTPTGLFLPSVVGGSDSTYYCDNTYLSASANTYVSAFGGGWSVGAGAGAFYWYLGNAASDAGSYLGSRLCRA